VFVKKIMSPSNCDKDVLILKRNKSQVLIKLVSTSILIV
jgi:hypothetical protein